LSRRQADQGQEVFVMQASDPAAAPTQNTVSVVLQASATPAAVLAAVRRVSELLAGVTAGYEILVAGSAGAGEVAEAVREEATRNPHVRWLSCAGPADYARLLHLGSQAARFSLVAVAESSLDLDTLAYLVPLALRYPVVCGYRLERGQPVSRRLCSWGYNALARFLLGTRVRDCGSGLMVFWRSVLNELLPEPDSRFAGAEVLAHTRRLGLAVAEVPVRPAPVPSPGPRWRHLPGTVAAFLSFWWSRSLFPGRPPSPQQAGAWRFGLPLLLLAALLLFPELNQPLLDPDEGRQAEIPREMLAHADFLTPRMLGKPYYEKPPLQYWLTAVAYSLFGLHPWAARLVPALAAWLTVLLTYSWGRRTLGTRAAFLGGVGLCLSLGFNALGRTVVLDSLLTCCVVASWYAAHSAVSGPAFRWRWWLASAAACGLGVLAKGPIAVVLLGVPLAGYLLLAAGTCRPRLPAWLAYPAVAAAVAAPWYLTMALTDPGYLNQFLWKANVVRFVAAYDHQQPWWYYLPVLFIGTLPWSLLWVWLGYFLASRSRRIVLLRTPALGFCALAVGWCLVFFSLSGCKSPLYVAPALAPLALMHGVCLDAILFRRVGRKDRFMGLARQVWPRRATLVVLLLSAAGYTAGGLLGWEDPAVVAAEVAVSLAAVAAWWRYGRYASPKLAWTACAAATVAMMVVSVRDLVAGFAARHSLEAIACIARRWPGNEGRLVMSYGRQWPSASFYLRRDAVTFVPQQCRAQLVEVLKQQPETLVLVESGALLDALLAALPPNLEAKVTRPAHKGQAALVVVRQR
jgi:dolichol-phosphate mannosyltransferase